MKRYLLAALDLTENPDPKKIAVSQGHNVPERLRDWLETGFKQFTKDRFTFTISEDPHDLHGLLDDYSIIHTATQLAKKPEKTRDTSAIEEKTNAKKHVISIK
jgi:hypothetical protein